METLTPLESSDKYGQQVKININTGEEVTVDETEQTQTVGNVFSNDGELNNNLLRPAEGEAVKLDIGRNSSNQLEQIIPDEPQITNNEDGNFFEDFASSFERNFTSTGANYVALFGDEEEAKKIVSDANKENPGKDTVGDFLGMVAAGIAPTMLALIPGPQQPIMMAAVIAHYFMDGAGNGLMTAWNYEDETGNELSTEAKVAISAGFGATAFIAEGVGNLALKKSLQRLSGTALEKIGKALMTKNVTLSAKTIVKEIGKASLRDGTIEGLQEGAEQLIQNGIQELFDERRTAKDILEGVKESVAGGFVGGMFIGGIGVPMGKAYKSDLNLYEEDISKPVGRLRKEIRDAGGENIDTKTINYTVDLLQGVATRFGYDLDEFITETGLTFQRGGKENKPGVLFQKTDIKLKRIPKFDVTSDTNDAVALGKALRGNPQLIAELNKTIKNLDKKYEELVQGTGVKSMSFANKLMELSKVKQLYREAMQFYTQTGVFAKEDVRNRFSDVAPLGLENALFVYHGTAADFKGDKFDYKFMLTGEGQIALGAGFYFSDLFKVAKYYAGVAKRNRMKDILGKDTYNYVEEDIIGKINDLTFFPEFQDVDDHIKTGLSLIISDFTLEDFNSFDEFLKGKLGKGHALLYPVSSPFYGGDYNFGNPEGEGKITKKVIEVLKQNRQMFDKYYQASKRLVLEAKIKPLKEEFTFIPWADELNRSKGIFKEVTEELSLRHRDSNELGSSFYLDIVKAFGGNEIEASRYLAFKGIDGVMAPAGYFSGNKTEGAYNYVVFDPDQIEIQKKKYFQKQAEKILGSFSLEDNKRVISLMEDANESTIIHELGHFVRSILDGEFLETVNEVYKVDGNKWTVQNEEEFARDWERFFYDGVTVNKRMRDVFTQFSNWLGRIYNNVNESPISNPLSDNKKKIFESIISNRPIEQGSIVQFVIQPLNNIAWKVMDITDDNKVRLAPVDDVAGKFGEVTTDIMNVVRWDTGVNNLQQRISEEEEDAKKRGDIFLTANQGLTAIKFLFDKSGIISPEKALENNDFGSRNAQEIIDAHLEYTFSKQDVLNSVDRILIQVMKDLRVKKKNVKEVQKKITKRFWEILKTGQFDIDDPIDIAAKYLTQVTDSYKKQIKDMRVRELFESMDIDIEQAFFEVLSFGKSSFKTISRAHKLSSGQVRRLKNRLKSYERIIDESLDPIADIAIAQYKIVDEAGNILGVAKSKEEAYQIRDEYKDLEIEPTIEKLQDKDITKEERQEYLKNQDNLWNFLPAYISVAERQLKLIPVINKVKRAIKENQDNVPPEVISILRKQIKASIGTYWIGDKIVDGFLNKLSDKNIIKRVIGKEARAASRVLGKARNFEAKTKLGYRPVAAFINALSGYGHTWTKVGNEYMQKAADFMNTPEGQRFLREEKAYTGIGFSIIDSGEIVSRLKLYQPLGLFQWAEPHIREHSLAANYLYAKEVLGISDEYEARRFSRKALRFQNFTYNAPSLPAILRNPAGQVMFQFKSYLIKEMEFITSLRGGEIARYIGMQVALGGPRGIVYTLKTVPILAALGLLDDIEEWLLSDDTGLSRGIGGVAGVDITGPATFQLPNDEVRDYIGPFLSDVFKLYSTVVKPAVSGEGYVFPESKEDLIVGTRAIDYTKSLAPIMYYWDDLIKNVVTNDGWAMDSAGNKSYRLEGWYDQLKLLLGAAPLEKGKVKSLENLFREETMQRENRKKYAIRKLVKELKLTGKINNDILLDLINLGMTPAGIVSRIKLSNIPPKYRHTILSIRKFKPRAVEMFEGVK